MRLYTPIDETSADQRHVALVLLSLVALQLLERDWSETAGQVNERFHLLSITGPSHVALPVV